MDKISGFLLNEKSGNTKLILLYRYISWAITSIFYLVGAPHSTLLFKMGVIGFLFVALLLVKDIFTKNEENPNVLKALVIVETVGITLLLLPTGGIDSPFIWYALNPVLIAASYLSGAFCWGLLFFYMGISSILSQSHQNSYLYLVLILITIVFQLFANLTKELKLQARTLEEQRQNALLANKQLIVSNQKTNEAMEHIMALYQTIESFTAQSKVDRLVETVLDFTEKLTKSPSSFCLLAGDRDSIFITRGNSLSKDLFKQCEKKASFKMNLEGEMYHVVQIQSSTYTGFLGIKNEGYLFYQDSKLLKFIADITSVILERFYMEEATEQFLLVEEQNRIANEIHDSVSQRVFGMVYGLHSLKKKMKVLPEERVMEELDFLTESASLTMKELRASIYQLSTKKQGTKLLFTKIQDFLRDIEKLHDISIVTSLSGDEDEMSSAMKKAVYRIVCEACGNAIRHGKSKMINVNLSVQNGQVTLSIEDDGIGFDFSRKITEGNVGLGIGNMQSLVQSHHGNLNIESKQNMGTRVHIWMPLMIHSKEVVGL